MKIKYLKIKNFKAIKSLEISDLQDTIVIAGPNGCGKSCIFEAIKLFKTTYGSYTANETNNLENELQIKKGKTRDFNRIKRIKSEEIEIEIDFSFSDEEKEHIKGLFEDQIEQDVLKEMVPKAQMEEASVLAIPHHLKERHEKEVERRRLQINDCLEKDNFRGYVNIKDKNRLTYHTNSLLSFIFSHWDGDKVGVMHLTSAERQFGRTQINSVNINLENIKDQSANHSLYATSNRYNQFQNHLASHTAYAALRKDLGLEQKEDSYFQDSLADLFERFIPGKKYTGPDFDENGSLDFFVETREGIRHGINDLSSGEKQILFGYIELFNSAPKNSILMIDEPELHLNPKIVKSLPSFYDKHIGRHFGNQLWLITHSDALLREACKSNDFSVFWQAPDTVDAW